MNNINNYVVFSNAKEQISLKFFFYLHVRFDFATGANGASYQSFVDAKTIIQHVFFEHQFDKEILFIALLASKSWQPHTYVNCK